MELRPDDAVREWTAGKFRPVYYLFGEESAEKSDALLRLKSIFKADEFNHHEFSGEPFPDPSAVIGECMVLPVFADRRLVIARSAKIPAAAREALAAYLASPNPTTTLVLFSEDRRPDRKDGLAAAAATAGAVCVFAPLDEDAAVGRLIDAARARGKTLAPEAAEVLVEEAGADWGILTGELEKLVVFCGETPVIAADDARACLGYRRSADPWAFERLIQTRDVKACLEQLASSFADEKPEEVVFRSLAQIRGAYLKQLKAKRLEKSGVARPDIERRLRIFYDRGFFDRLGRVGEARLRRDLRRCLDVESDLKSKPWLDAKLELERLVVELCTPTRLPAATA